MAALSTQTINTTSGLQPSYTAASSTDTFTPDDRTFIWAKNTNGSTRTLAVTTYQTPRGLTVTNPAPTIAATTGELFMGPFPADMYASPSTGLATITPSATAGVTYAIVRLAVAS